MVPKRIIVHHSLTKDSGTVSWGAIRHYHTHDLGWLDIGYHAGVELVQSGGHQYYELLIGRPWNAQGAHASFQNYDTLGLCLVGNFDLAPPPDDQLKKAASLVSFWMALYNIRKDRIFGHSDFSGKTCPGKLFPWKAFLDDLPDL